MGTPQDTENLRPVFLKLMRLRQLRPEDVEKSRARRDVFNTGTFECVCGRTWESKFSWLTFDLIELEIVKRWKMLCKECHALCNPTFTVDQLKEMYDRAITMYLPRNQVVINIGYGSRHIYTEQHPSVLCEKCEWGAIICWRFYFRR